MISPKFSICSGYFNPVGPHHIDYFKGAMEFGDVLLIVNNDEQVKLKGSIPFMNLDDRVKILSHFQGIQAVFPSIDTDQFVVKTLTKIRKLFSERLVLCNGGDQLPQDSPEVKFCKENDIELAWNVGGCKTNSSSKIIGAAISGQLKLFADRRKSLNDPYN